MSNIKYLKYILILFSIFSIVTSCKTRSKIKGNSNEVVLNYKFKDIRNILNTDQLDFKTIDAKLKLSLDLEKKMSAKATLRMKKDESVWMSVSYFGLEVARMKMDKEKISILDKVNKKHYTLEYESWNEKYGTEFSISHFQKLLLGQPVESINRQFHWSQNEGIVNVDNERSSKDLYWLFYQLEQSTLVNQTISTKDQQLKCLYSVKRISQIMPENVKVDLKMDTKIKVDISTNKVDVNKSIKMPFKVSSKYENVVL